MPTFIFDATCAASVATSYATTQEADSYIELFYPDSGWLSIEGEQEEVLAKKQSFLVLATRIIDSLPIYGRKFLDSTTPYRQALKFPTLGHPVVASVVEQSNNTEQYTEIYPSGIRYRTDATKETLVGGSVLIYSGNLKGAIKRIVDYDESTQKITCEKFSEAPPVGTFIYIIFPIPRPVVAACCEQARFLLEGLGTQAAELSAAGIKSLGTSEGSVTLDEKGTSALLSPTALAQIKPYLRTYVEAQRG